MALLANTHIAAFGGRRDLTTRDRQRRIRRTQTYLSTSACFATKTDLVDGREAVVEGERVGGRSTGGISEGEEWRSQST